MQKESIGHYWPDPLTSARISHGLRESLISERRSGSKGLLKQHSNAKPPFCGLGPLRVTSEIKLALTYHCL